MRKIENYSRVNFALILILFIFILENCKKEEAIEKSGNELNKTEAKQANQDYAIILNQNGIPFYQTALDLKSKFDSIPFGGRIILTNENINSDSQEAGNWFSAIYQGKKGFVFSDNAYSGKEWIQMSETKVNNEKTKQDEAAFSVVQSMNTVMYDLPSIESKKIGEIPQFSLISILSSGYYFDSFFIDNIDLEMGQERLWYEVSYNGKNGYILNSINYPVEKSVAEEQLRDKILSERGYFALTTKEPTLYNIDTKELFGKDFKVKLLKENIFFDTTESRLINGEQVYLIYFSDKMSLSPRKKPKNPAEDNTPYAAYISAKDGNYYSEEKFSEYTIENTKYKGDIAALNLFKSEFVKRGIYLNYLDFTVKKISGEGYPKDTYYIATAKVGNSGSDFNASQARSVILKQSDGVYEAVSGSIYTSKPMQFKDLDGDGVMEIIAKTPNRGGDDTTIFGLKDGKYVSVNSVLSQMGVNVIDIKGDKIRGSKWNTSTDEKQNKNEILLFKYDKGNLVEIKNNK